MSSNTQVHIVIGAGATGTATALRLVEDGHDVKVITRSGSGPTHPSIELTSLDASDVDQLTHASRGATAIYNCANPPYHKWSSEWPPLAASILGATQATEAVLVTLSNLYGYGQTDPMRSSDTLQPPSVKGSMRTEMWRQALEAHEAGRVRITEARASDFIGPGLGANGHMGDRVVPRVIAGKSVSLLGRTDVAHSWTAISDVAETMVLLGTDERAWGRPWHVPTDEPLSQAALVHLMCELAAVEPVKVKTVPSIALALGGMVVPALRELKEIMYQFEQPFVLDSSDTTDTFGLKPTPIAETLMRTIDSYR